MPTYWPLAVALLLFGALGIRRGWVRELATLGGVLLVWLVLFGLGFTILGTLNRLALIVAFSWQGGFDLADPVPLLRSLKAAPPIDPWHPESLYLLLFAVGTAAAYLVGNRMVGRVDSPAEAVLGGLAGALNGYVIAYVALGYAQVTLRGPASGDALALLASHGTTVIVAVVIIAVLFALVATNRIGGLKAKRSGRGGD